MTLTGSTPPVVLVPKVSGALKELNAEDGQFVEEGTFLAVIENSASTKDLMLLKQQLGILIQYPDSILNFPYYELNLGNVQGLYTSFLHSLDSYQQFVKHAYYPRKINSIKNRIVQNEEYYRGMQKQYEITTQQFHLAKISFERDSLLNEKNILSRQDIENAYSQYLQSKLTQENSYSALENLRIQISQLEETLLDVEQQYQDTKNSLESELNTICIQLINEIKTWEITYALVAPISGQVTFTTYWSENQYVTAGESVFTIIPDDMTNMVGKALLPTLRSGKVKIGQGVNIYFTNFPDEEFGLVRGTVKIFVSSCRRNYVLEISLPNGLHTTYNKELPYMPEMHAQADIITEDLSLLERFIMPLKKYGRKECDKPWLWYCTGYLYNCLLL